MRAGWGLIGLLLTLALVAVLAKKQLGIATTPLQATPTVTGAVPAGTVVEQSRAIQDQVKQQVEAQMQARPISDADK